ncbi:MAG: hypothetical protein ABIP79_13400 [Chitinophagaceae bacterium]
MEKILKEVKKLSETQKLKLYNTLQKVLYSPEKTAKKELNSDEWNKISSRITDLKTGKTNGISLKDHLNWLKQRRNAI